MNNTGRNITLPIYNADGSPFHDLVIHKATYESVVMSLGDKITGDVYYKDNSLIVTMSEYIVYDNVRYVLVNPPTVIREGMVSDNGELKGMTKYSFVFYHPMYMLANFPFSDVAVTESEERYLSQNKTFSWIGTMPDFIAKINANLERTEWFVQYQSTQNDVSRASEMSDVLSFDNNTIADALKKAYDTWEVPFIIKSYNGILPSAYTRLEWVKIEEMHQTVSGETSPIFLFLDNLSSVYVDHKIYYCRIYNGDVLTHQFIPCLNDNDDVGLYDDVSGVFYGSTSQVVFSAGQTIGKGKNHEIIFGIPSNEIYDSSGNVFVFKFGQGVGLKNNSRNPRNNKIITRIAGYGSDGNIPYGYPQVVWHGNPDWEYTGYVNENNIVVEDGVIQNSPKEGAYPLYWGIVGGQRVKLIKHPFTRNHLMPSVYSECVENKVSPYISYNSSTGVATPNPDYDPELEIIDYYDATSSYPNPIKPLQPSYEIHQFEDIKPRLDENTTLLDAWAYAGGNSYTSVETMDNPNDGGNIGLEAFRAYVRQLYVPLDSYYPAVSSLGEFDNSVAVKRVASDKKEGGAYNYEWSVSINNAGYVVAKYVSDRYNIYKTVIFADESEEEEEETRVDWNDAMDDDGNYIQRYFKMKLPQLSFDIYASAAITEEMKINMRSGACIGCTFPIQVDWEDYKKNFYDENNNFDPVIGEGHPRNANKYPDSSSGSITVIVQKEYETFGTIMPNIYQQPKTGDKFVILGISLPTSYITSAEHELDDAMKEYMLENNVYYFDYPLKFDEYFLATHTDILSQIRNNTKVNFEYGSERMALFVKQITIKYNDDVLPKYDITLTDDVEIVLNQLGQVTDDVSRLRVELSELQKYYGGGNADALNEKLSRVVDDVAQGKITFQKGIDVLEKAIFSQELCSPDYRSGLYDGNGWHIDNLGNSEFESIRVRSFLEVVELLVNRLQAQEGDTLFTDNDQIEKVQPEFAVYQCKSGDNPKSLNLYERELDENDNYVYTPTSDTTVNPQKTYYRICSYILSLKEKYDGYFTPQQVGNILKGIINTLAAKQANVSDEENRSVEVDGENKYYTSWMRVTGTHASDENEIGNNQIRVELYSDDYDTEDPETHEITHHHFTPAGINFPPCELMTIARWGCYLDPDEKGISQGEKLSRERRQRMFMISVTDGRVVKYTKVNSPVLSDYNYGVTIGELPQFVKNYPDVSSVLSQVGEHSDWLYAQGIVVGKFIKVDIYGKPEVVIVDCGDWVDGGAQGVTPTPQKGIYYHDAWNAITQQYETHDVWHSNVRWRCLVSQPIKDGQLYIYNEPEEGSVYWKKIQGAIEGKDGTSAVSVFKWNTSPTTPPSISGKDYPPSGWRASAPARPNDDNQYLWMSTANLVGNNKVDAWSAPVRISGDKGDAGADADDREWIYIGDSEYRIPYADNTHSHPKDITYGEVSPNGTASGSENNKNLNDWVPNGWSDRAIAVDPTTNLFVYASWRDKGSNGNWGNFQNPILWSNWGVQGLDGDGIQYIFKLFDHELSSSERVTQVPDNAVMNRNGEWMPQNESPSTKNNDWNDDAPSTTPSMQYCYCSTIKQIRGEWEKLQDNRHGKFNTLALWSKWSEDGESAPFYTEEWFAWSDDETTSSVNTSPTIEGDWSSTIPQKNARYLWRKSVKYVLNSNNEYVAQAAEYFRMSGTDGASIKTKGTAVVVITSSGSFPTSTSAGYKTGDIGLKQGDSTPYKATVSGSTVSWSKSGMSASNDGDSYTITKDCIIDLDGDGTSANIKGHLVTWSEEAGKWVDLGEFKGEDGETWYSHIVWATNVVYNETTGDVTSIVGYTPAKSPNDTTHVWMGTHVDQNQQDPTSSSDSILREYTWSYTKGADGTDARQYLILSDADDIVVERSGTTTFTNNVYFYYRDGNETTNHQYSTHYSIYKRTIDNTYEYITGSTENTVSSAQFTCSGVSSSLSAIVVYIHEQKYSNFRIPPRSVALSIKEIPVIPSGERGKVGRFFYYAGEWDATNNTDTFVINDVQAPYFSKAGSSEDSYYVFNREETPSGGAMSMAQMATETTVDGQIRWNNKPWEIMTNDFKYLITEAIFGSYAHFGGAIINGDYILSQYGYMRGYGGKTINITDNTQYTYVDPDDMFGEEDLSEKPHIVNNTTRYDLDTTISRTLGGMFELKAGRYYTIEIDGYCSDNGKIDYQIKRYTDQHSVFEGEIKGYRTDNDFYPSYGIFKVQQGEGGYYNVYCNKSLSDADAAVKGVYILPAQFVPNWCVDLIQGKNVANNIIARGELHADSLYYTMTYGDSNDDTIRVDEESIINLSTRAVGTTVILPSVDNSKGRIVEVFNNATSWKATWENAETSRYSGFKAAYGSQYGYNFSVAIQANYVKFYCDGDAWWVLFAYQKPA